MEMEGMNVVENDRPSRQRMEEGEGRSAVLLKF